MLKLSPEVERIRSLVGKRLLDDKQIAQGEQDLSRMLVTLGAGDFVTLEPEPPQRDKKPEQKPAEEPVPKPAANTLGSLLAAAQAPTDGVAKPGRGAAAAEPPREIYMPRSAEPTAKLDRLLAFKSVNPVYGSFLVDLLGSADESERIQALESVLEMPRPVRIKLPVPPPPELPLGSLATTRLDGELLRRGLLAAADEEAARHDRHFHHRRREEEEELPPPPLADKLRLLFRADFPGVDVRIDAVWAAGELLRLGGDFDLFVKSRDLVKQEGIVFRHLLRLILLCAEFADVCPDGADPGAWRADLQGLAERPDRLLPAGRSGQHGQTDRRVTIGRSADRGAGLTQRVLRSLNAGEAGRLFGLDIAGGKRPPGRRKSPPHL